MSNDSFWDRERLAPEQLPTLQELLECCDEGLLVRVIVDEHAARADGFAPSPKRRRAMEKRLARTLASMRALHVKGKAGRMQALLPEESFVLHGGSGLVERRLSASLVRVEDATLLARSETALGESGGGDADERVSDGRSAPDGRFDPPRQPYALAPWERTLASPVWLAGPWCRRERYLVLASSFWEMTFFGFEYERAVAEQARERAKRALGGEGAPGAAAGPSDSRAPVPETAADRARWFDLVEPDRFEEDYRDRLVARVAELNRIARADFRIRCRAFAVRTGRA